MRPEPGLRLGPYELVAPLGAGGMGEVWRARDPRLGREVAVKLLAAGMVADADARRRFEREARAAAALSHPAILSVFDVGSFEDRPYLVSELLRGNSLREQLAHGALDPQLVVGVGLDLARALGAAHRAGVVHRDLKPENVFLTDDGRTKILDFGLATLAEGADGRTDVHTRTGMVVGTVGYIAPEQLQGEKAGPPADLFALGCLLYEALAGAPAFRSHSVAATLSAVLHREPTPLGELRPGIPPALESLIRDCLDKAPERRPDAFEVVRRLGELTLSGPTAVISQPAPRPQVASPRRRRTWLAVGATLVVAAALALWTLLRAAPSAAPAPATVAAPPEAQVPGGSDQRGTSDEQAWRLYLRGRYAWEKRGDSLLEAKDLFRAAVERDPAFARAWLGLADTYAILNDYTSEPASETFPKAKAAAQRALEIDPGLAGAHTDLAYVAFLFERDWSEAERRFRRALELDPTSAKTRQWFAELLASQGRFDEAIEEVRKAQGLDPLAPMMVADEVWMQVMADRPEAAQERAEEAGEFRQFGPLRAYEGLALVLSGHAEEARTTFAELAEAGLSPVISLWLAHAEAAAGDAVVAQRTLDAARARYGDRDLIAYYRAYPLLRLGRKEEALAALRESLRRQEGQVVWMRVDPNLAPLRGDPRFEALLREAGFSSG